MSLYESLAAMDLMVPNISTAIIDSVIPGKKASSFLILFAHPEDVSKGEREYEKIGMTYSKNAVLPPQKMEDGSSRSYNLSGVRLISLLEAAGATEDEIKEIFTSGRDEQVELLQRFVGVAVRCNYISGRVKGGDGVTRVSWKFPDVDWENFHDFIEDAKNSFVPADDEEFGDVVGREANRKKLTRPDNAVVPMSMVDGDEFV